MFRTKDEKKIDPFEYLNRYFNTKMAIIIESIYVSKNIVSLQIEAHEVCIKILKQREALLSIKESDDEDEEDDEDKSVFISDIDD